MPITAPNHHLSKNFPDSDFLFGNYQRALLVTVAVLRAGRSGEPVRTISPVEIEDPLSNPRMGWGLRVGPRYFDGRQFTLAYNTSGFGDDAPFFSWMMEGRSRFSGARLRRGGLGYRLTLTRASWRESIPAGSLFLLKQTWVNRNSGRCRNAFLLCQHGNSNIQRSRRQTLGKVKDTDESLGFVLEPPGLVLCLISLAERQFPAASVKV